MWFVFLVLLFLIPASLIGFFAYKLVTNLKDKEKRKEDKKKLKQQRKEKDPKTKKRQPAQHSKTVADSAENHVREKKARG